MGLSLLAGPANAGKVALLLERYLARLDDEPVLIVPNRSDVDRVERDLLARSGCLLGGAIGTFDDLFGRLAAGDPGWRPVCTDAQRALVVRRALAGVSLNGLARSARTGGFGESLVRTLGELESGLLDPSDVDGDLALLYAAYRAELDRLEVWDRDLQRRRAAERVQSDLDAWHGEPVFAYGFEDLTGAEWALLEALAGRTEVHVSLPYEPGRLAFASLSRTADDLAALAGGEIEELAPRSAEYAHPALAHLERALFEESPPPPPELDAAVRFFEGAGIRGMLELVGEEAEKLREAPIPQLAELRAAPSPTSAVRALVRAMVRAAYGTEAPPAGETSRLDLRTYDAVLRLLDELDGFGAYGGELTAEEVFAALERAEVRLAGSGEVGRVAVLDLLRARTRRFEVVFLLGLEEGSLPRRSRVSPFLDDD